MKSQNTHLSNLVSANNYKQVTSRKNNLSSGNINNKKTRELKSSNTHLFSRVAMACIITLIGSGAAQAEIDLKRDTIDYHGYIRTGIGMSEGGSQQVVFQAPSTPAKYRLGNENDTYMELAADYRHYFDSSSNKSVQFVARTDTGSSYSDNDFDFEMAEAYVSLDNIVGEDIKVWVGRRFYDRRDIHMNDYFWQKSNEGVQGGAGIEGIHALGGNLKVALLRYNDDNVIFAGTRPTQGSGAVDPLVDKNFGESTTTVLDVRLEGLAIDDNNSLNLMAQIGEWSGVDDYNLGSEMGYTLSAWNDTADLWGGTNTLAISYRQGATALHGRSVASINEHAVDLSNTDSFEIDNNYVNDINDTMSVQWIALYNQESRGVERIDGTSTGDTVTWMSTGVRPIYYLNKNINMALEVGIDHVDDEVNDFEGNLDKVTLALQLTNDLGYYNRPVIRAFVTYASWSNELKGLVAADTDYADKTEGWSTGIQVETWW
ncbi:carbohydrate porin [Shewanella violacea]